MRGSSFYFCRKVDVMAYIKRLKNNELVGGTDNTDVYPYTTAEAVYDKSKVTQQVINDRLLTKVSLLEESTNSLVNLKELIEEFLEGGDYGSGVLSDNNFTDALKAKLEGLENYNDSELRGLLNDVNAALNAKANKSTTYTKAEVDDKIANIDISSQISNFATDEELANGLATKQNTIANLQQIEDGAALGATAYQKPETGIPAADLAAGIQSSLNKAETALQSHQDISGKANASDVYTKQTVDTMLSGKADAGSTYSKSVIDSKIATVDNKIPDTSAFRTEAQINTLISTALVDVVYAGETTGTASSDGEGEGGGSDTTGGITRDELDQALANYTTLTAFNAKNTDNLKTVNNTSLVGSGNNIAIDADTILYTDSNGIQSYVDTGDSINAAITGLDTAIDNEVATSVHKTGNETIAGEKKFTGKLSFQGENGEIVLRDQTNADPILYNDRAQDFSWIITDTTENSSGVVSGWTLQQALNSKASDGAVVHKTGDEKISGEKTFSPTGDGYIKFISDGNNTIITNYQSVHPFDWIIDADGTCLSDVLNSLVDYRSNRILPAVTSANNNKILKVVNGRWTLADDATGNGGGGVDSTAVHQTGTETVDGVKTLIGTLAVEDGRGGQISCTDLDNFDWIVVRGGTTLQSVLTAMTNRITALETKLASIYSYDSSTNTLTINDPNSNS